MQLETGPFYLQCSCALFQAIHWWCRSSSQNKKVIFSFRATENFFKVFSWSKAVVISRDQYVWGKSTLMLQSTLSYLQRWHIPLETETRIYRVHWFQWQKVYLFTLLSIYLACIILTIRKGLLRSYSDSWQINTMGFRKEPILGPQPSSLRCRMHWEIIYYLKSIGTGKGWYSNGQPCL